MTADNAVPKHRSWNMSRIRSKDTFPERRVRSSLHRLGFRFRLHRRDLPGSPDIVLPKHKTVVFVHGCYWHRHNCKNGSVVPKTRTRFWQHKFTATRHRDLRAAKALEAAGWRVLVVWECQTDDDSRLLALLSAAFRTPAPDSQITATPESA